MKAQKITLTVKMEALSVDTLPGLIRQLEGNFSTQKTAQNIEFDDGDTLGWVIEKTPVEF